MFNQLLKRITTCFILISINYAVNASTPTSWEQSFKDTCTSHINKVYSDSTLPHMCKLAIENFVRYDCTIRPNPNLRNIPKLSDSLLTNIKLLALPQSDSSNTAWSMSSCTGTNSVITAAEYCATNNIWPCAGSDYDAPTEYNLQNPIEVSEENGMHVFRYKGEVIDKGVHGAGCTPPPPTGIQAYSCLVLSDGVCKTYKISVTLNADSQPNYPYTVIQAKTVWGTNENCYNTPQEFEAVVNEFSPFKKSHVDPNTITGINCGTKATFGYDSNQDGSGCICNPGYQCASDAIDMGTDGETKFCLSPDTNCVIDFSDEYPTPSQTDNSEVRKTIPLTEQYLQYFAPHEKTCGMNFLGSPLSLDNMSLDDCAQQCLNSPGCMGIKYLASVNKCMISSSLMKDCPAHQIRDRGCDWQFDKISELQKNSITPTPIGSLQATPGCQLTPENMNQPNNECGTKATFGYDSNQDGSGCICNPGLQCLDSAKQMGTDGETVFCNNPNTNCTTLADETPDNSCGTKATFGYDGNQDGSGCICNPGYQCTSNAIDMGTDGETKFCLSPDTNCTPTVSTSPSTCPAKVISNIQMFVDHLYTLLKDLNTNKPVFLDNCTTNYDEQGGLIDISTLKAPSCPSDISSCDHYGTLIERFENIAHDIPPTCSLWDPSFKIKLLSQFMIDDITKRCPSSKANDQVNTQKSKAPPKPLEPPKSVNSNVINRVPIKQNKTCVGNCGTYRVLPRGFP